MSEASVNLLSFLRRLAADGDRPAVVALRVGGAVTVSRAELAATSLRLAAGLAAHGLAAGDTVAIVAPNSVQVVVLRLALGALGAVAVALDETGSNEEIAAGLVESRAGMIFASPGQAARLARFLAPGGPALYRLDRSGDPSTESSAGISWLDLMAAAPAPLTEPGPAAPAVLVLGGGTGSESPPFCLSHENIVAGAAALVDAGLFKPRDRVVLALPLTQVYPLTVGLYGVLASGGAMVLPEALDSRQLRRAIRLAGATAVLGVPALYQAWLDGIAGRVESRAAAGTWFRVKRVLARAAAGRVGRRLGRGLFRPLHREIGPRLQGLISGGDRLDGAAARDLEALGWRVTSGYTVSRVAGFVALGHPGRPGTGALFRPLNGLELRSPEPGERDLGRIELSGPQVVTDMERPCPLLTEDGWLRTGDLGTLDGQGRLSLAGPEEERITLDGESLFAEQLEAVYGACPLVEEIAVLARDERLHGCVLPDLEAAAACASPRIEQVVRQALAEQAARLPQSHALASIALLRRPLPRTALGRLRRDLLPRLYTQAAGKHPQVRAAALSEADRALLAKPRVREVWDWLQARTPGRAIGMDFHPQLDLDIDSLGWLAIGLELEQRFGLRLDEDTLSRMETLREFMTEVRRAPETAASDPAAPTLMTLDESQRRRIAPPGAALKALGAMLHGMARPLVRRFFRLRVDGLENLPDEGAVIFAVNHMSPLDSLVLAAALPRDLLRRTYWAGGGSPGLFGRALRVFAVDPRAPGRSLAMAHEVLARGQPLVWFPEGRPARDQEALRPFLPGIGALVAETGVSVVPVRIVGTGRAMAPGRWLPRRHPVAIGFGKPRAARELIAGTGGRTDFAGIAEAVREAVAALPATGPRRGRRFPLWRRLGWLLEAGAAWLLYGLLVLLPLDAASNFCGFVARNIGPRLGLSRKARRNLERAFPESSPAEFELIVRDMWDNLGRSIGELVHLDRLKMSGPDPRIELVGQEHLEPVRRGDRPCIFFTAHLANWEIAALSAALTGLPLTLIYRPANNPYVEGLIQHCRKPHLGDYVSKGSDAVSRIGQAMQRRERLGMVVDQKTNNGVPAPFFGREAMTTPVLAFCALNRDCILLPAQVERLRGARFRVTVHPPIEVAPSGDKAADVRTITTQVNATIEGWVRQRPAQWLWLHKRWPD